jgi:hypothetical protein
MALNYKILFEVKLIHEYFFTDKNGDTIFAQADQSDRMNMLLDEFSGDRKSINDDVNFEFPEKLLSLYKNYHLKIIPGFSGCKVAIRFNQKTFPDNSQVYEPFETLPDNFDINILVTKKNNLIERYSNSILSRPINSQYFFTSESSISPKTFPFLTNDISVLDSGKAYQQGALASFGTNDIREFYNDGTADQWLPVSGNSFANENDQLLVPSKFYYSFDEGSGITDATFELRDKDSNIIKSITIHNNDFIRKTLLDFSDKTNLISIPESFVYPDIIYSLIVSGSNGFAKTHSLIFDDNFYGRDNWGLINIRTKVTNASFNLIATDGYLIKRRSASNVWTEAPIFEVFVKSRFVFWRFRNVNGKELKLDPSLTDYLFKDDVNLLSLQPNSISNSYFKLPKQGSTDTKYFPGPVNFEIAKDEKERICFDIMVPVSDLFPVMP